MRARAGVGIDAKSLIYNVEQLQSRVSLLIKDYGGALVEQYVDGREYSVLVVGRKGALTVRARAWREQ